MDTITIMHRHTGAVLYSHQAAPNRVASGLAMRDALEAASLAGANLDGANLDGANLVGNRPILQIGPIGSRCAYLVSYITDAGIKVRAGCFFGSIEEFEAACAKTHGDNDHGKEYAAAVAMIRAHAAIWTPWVVA